MLAEHGQLFIEPVDVNAFNFYTHKELPISENCPRLELSIPGEIIRSLLPEVAGTLGIDRRLDLTYFYPRYRPINGGDLYYQPPVSSFDVPIGEGSEDEYGTGVFVRVDDPDTNPDSNTCTGTRSPLDSTLPENRDKEDVPITRDECTALKEIVDNLEVILAGS